MQYQAAIQAQRSEVLEKYFNSGEISSEFLSIFAAETVDNENK